MTRRHTDADVTELADAVQFMLRIHSASIAPAMRGRLKRAIAPFLPDPEHVLIEKMVEAYNQSLNHNSFPKDTNYDQVRMRAALAVVKREGLPE